MGIKGAMRPTPARLAASHADEWQKSVAAEE